MKNTPWLTLGLAFVLLGGGRLAIAASGACDGDVHFFRPVGMPHWQTFGLTCSGPCPAIGGMQGDCTSFVYRTLPNGSDQLTCACVYKDENGETAQVLLDRVGEEPACDAYVIVDLTVQPPLFHEGGCSGACPGADECDEGTVIEWIEDGIEFKIADCDCFPPG